MMVKMQSVAMYQLVSVFEQLPFRKFLASPLIASASLCRLGLRLYIRLS